MIDAATVGSNQKADPGMSKTAQIAAFPEGEGAAKGGKAALIVIAAAATLLLGGGGGGAYVMLGTALASGHSADVASVETAPFEHGEGAEAALVDVPAMVVTLRAPGGDRRYLNIHVMLAPRTAAAGAAVKSRLPAIIGAYRPFLRALRPDDLAGAAAVFRIKAALLTRADAVMGQGEVEDVLIQDLVQQ